MKTTEQESARRLRREQGASVKEIATLLGVSRSSVSLWVRDVELTPEQHEALRQRNPAYNAQLNGSAQMSERYRAQRRRHQASGRTFAQRGDPFHAAGCMLYWVEGGKNRNQVRLSNSDPEVVRYFLRFLRAYFDVPDERVRVWCNLFADHLERQREVEQFWLDLLRLPRACLLESTVNTYSKYTRRKRTNLLPYGTCRVSVNNTAVLQQIYGAIQEYAGFERPEWLG